ncbi:methyl-accepting chemotaxis protein [Pseudomonas oryzihabitans]|uniref:methyl-accepting chemotaxis protein n=1 Tax=Pseudomonas oryzihabitans TaxID=47885 RepID=UPI002856F474|nr:methyl-accepting chemotaxis protein [Pseudomonas psychrotolerans]MDR6676090.1 methyl-accepting chemotaxis protein [Pseudomonas psychrotolerans]
MLRNAPLSTKLLLILLLPLAGFLVISSLYTAERYRTLKDMQHTVTASAAAQRISAVVTRLQRERGASGVFLGSGGKAMQDKLKSFRQDSDQAQSDLRAVASSDDVALQSVLHTLDGLPELRTKVDGLGLNSTQSGTAYTELIKALIGYTHALEAGVEAPAILRALGALNLFVEMKERAGRERVLLGLAFNQNRFDAALLSRFARNLGEFSAYADAFQRKATPAFIQQLDAAFKQPSAREVSRLQQLAFEIPLGDPLGVKPEDWFNLATQRIDLMSAVENDLGASVSVLAEQARARASHDLWTTLGLVLLVLVAVSALAWAIIRNIKQAVDQVNGTLTRLATRDLTARCAYQGRDEFGTITGNLNLMSQELGQVIQEIGAATVQVATAAEEASAVAVQTSQNVAQQRLGTDQVATAIAEMSATVKDVARSTTEAAEGSRQVEGNTSQGRRELQATISLVQGLSVQAERTSAIIAELKQESDSISSVLDVIRGIAEQTNLLALNAAIEAARAGEAGRGFAVVADEVRALAQKTQQSTGNIQQMISHLQAGSDRATQAMQETLSQVQTGASNVVRAGELLGEIAEGVTLINDRTIQVASAAEQQSQVAEEISRNVNDINDLVIQVSAGAEQTAVTSRELARLAEQQQSLVGRFRVA